MLSTIYISTTGLQSFAKALDVISSNVANVNTPGYKGTELLFQDLHYRSGLERERQSTWYGAQFGSGVAAELTQIRFTQGELRESEHTLDAAIEGRGLFVVEQDGELLYTRAGLFEFNPEGYLVVRGGGQSVMGLADGGLQRLSRIGEETRPAVPTARVEFDGNRSLCCNQHAINNVMLIDGLGGSRNVSINFRNNSTVAPRSWLIEVRDAADNLVASGGEIRFMENGAPAPGFNTYSFSYQAPNAAAQQITFDFGEPGSFSRGTSFAGGSASDLAVLSQDGRVLGTLLDATFDEQGQLTARYSNGERAVLGRLALAGFNDLQSLQQLGEGLFRTRGQRPSLAGAGERGLGTIRPKQLELANVELSQQFTDMIVVQRGYQASSQVLTVVNEMAQQLLEATK